MPLTTVPLNIKINHCRTLLHIIRPVHILPIHVKAPNIIPIVSKPSITY